MVIAAVAAVTAAARAELALEISGTCLSSIAVEAIVAADATRGHAFVIAGLVSSRAASVAAIATAAASVSSSITPGSASSLGHAKLAAKITISLAARRRAGTHFSNRAAAIANARVANVAVRAVAQAAADARQRHAAGIAIRLSDATGAGVCVDAKG